MNNIYYEHFKIDLYQSLFISHFYSHKSNFTWVENSSYCKLENILTGGIATADILLISTIRVAEWVIPGIKTKTNCND